MPAEGDGGRSQGAYHHFRGGQERPGRMVHDAGSVSFPGHLPSGCLGTRLLVFLYGLPGFTALSLIRTQLVCVYSTVLMMHHIVKPFCSVLEILLSKNLSGVQYFMVNYFEYLNRNRLSVSSFLLFMFTESIFRFPCLHAIPTARTASGN